jgi:hypothetical protein
MNVKLKMIDEGGYAFASPAKVVIVIFDSSFDRQQVLNAIAANDYKSLPASLDLGE